MKRLTLTMIGGCHKCGTHACVEASEMSRKQAIEAAAAVIFWATSGAPPELGKHMLEEIASTAMNSILLRFSHSGLGNRPPTVLECSIHPKEAP